MSAPNQQLAGAEEDLPTLTPEFSATDPTPTPARRSGAVRRTGGVDWLNRVLLLIVGILVLIPIGTLIFGAFSSAPPRAPGRKFTLTNLSKAFASSAFLGPLGHSVLLAAVVGVTSILVGGAMAFAIARMRLRFRRLWENLIVVPVYVSPLMMALASTAMFAPRVGFANMIMPDHEFFDIYGFWGIVWVLTVSYSGFVFLYLIAPMRGLNSEMEEAAAVLGARRLNIIRRVVVPMLWPSILSTFVVVFLLAAEEFAVPSLLGRSSQFTTLPNQIYYLLTYDPANPNLAAALGLMLLIIAMLGIAAYRRLTRNANRYVTVSGKFRAATSFGPRRLRWLPDTLMALWTLIAIFVPLAGLVLGSFLSFLGPKLKSQMFTLNNYEKVFTGTGPHIVANSLILSVLTATIVSFLGAVISYGLRFGRGRSRISLDFLSVATIGMPGSALAVGLLWAYVGLPSAIWGSIWILLIAFVTRTVVHGVRATSNSIMQASPHLDEAGQVLGAGLFRRLRTIQMPIMARGMRSAWILVFIFAVNEVTSSVLLYSQRSITIAVQVWNSIQMTGSSQAFAYAVVQGVVVALVLLIFNTFFGRRDARMERKN